MADIVKLFDKLPKIMQNIIIDMEELWTKIYSPIYTLNSLMKCTKRLKLSLIMQKSVSKQKKLLTKKFFVI